MSSGRRFRMDFEFKAVTFDDEARVVRGVMVPKPERYECREVKGERMLYDKLDQIYIPTTVLEDMARQALGMPLYLQRPQITNAAEYVASRRARIQQLISGEGTSAAPHDASEEFLESLAVDALDFVILVLDLVGSTRLASTTDPKTYATLITAFLDEASEVVPKFWGHVLKYTGDGLIAYFPAPSFITMNDLAIDCALTIRHLVYKAYNQVLRENNLPAVDVRVGLDSGKAFLTTLGSPATKRHKDIIGAVVSLAAKIQAQAPPGGIYLGRTTVENLHTNWRLACARVIPTDWLYRDAEGLVYDIYSYEGGLLAGYRTCEAARE